jgi:hypothetical protein
MQTHTVGPGVGGVNQMKWSHHNDVDIPLGSFGQGKNRHLGARIETRSDQMADAAVDVE